MVKQDLTTDFSYFWNQGCFTIQSGLLNLTEVEPIDHIKCYHTSLGCIHHYKSCPWVATDFSYNLDLLVY